MNPLTVHIGDSLAILRTLPSESVHCCVTSPPYWGLRNYNVAGQLGLEATPQEYVAKLVEVFEQVKRVLRDDGTLWLNLGDSYARQAGDDSTRGTPSTGQKRSMDAGADRSGLGCNKPPPGFRAKNLLGIPWRVAFALQESGWYLRQDIIWHKPNPMPESVRDRCTKAHEYLFLLAKSERYYFDAEAIQEAAVSNRPDMRLKGIRTGNAYLQQGPIADNSTPNCNRLHPLSADLDTTQVDVSKRNRRSVWTIQTQPYHEAHFATFPPALVEPCILAGCPVGGTVLDPFAGSGTTGMVALDNARFAILIELNPTYGALIAKRCPLMP